MRDDTFVNAVAHMLAQESLWQHGTEDAVVRGGHPADADAARARAGCGREP
jgi:hypothetical protein